MNGKISTLEKVDKVSVCSCISRWAGLTVRSVRKKRQIRYIVSFVPKYHEVRKFAGTCSQDHSSSSRLFRFLHGINRAKLVPVVVRKTNTTKLLLSDRDYRFDKNSFVCLQQCLFVTVRPKRRSGESYLFGSARDLPLLPRRQTKLS